MKTDRSIPFKLISWICELLVRHEAVDHSLVDNFMTTLINILKKEKHFPAYNYVRHTHHSVLCVRLSQALQVAAILLPIVPVRSKR